MMWNHHSSRRHEEYEAMTSLRIKSGLPPTLEALVHKIIGACLAVHCELGPGLAERAYSRACCIELEFREMSFEVEKPVSVKYRGSLLCQHRIDLFIDRQVVVEIKSVEQIHPVHVAQVVSYLRLTGT